jgi:hypothetical protein
MMTGLLFSTPSSTTGEYLQQQESINNSLSKQSTEPASVFSSLQLVGSNLQGVTSPKQGLSAEVAQKARKPPSPTPRNGSLAICGSIHGNLLAFRRWGSRLEQ